jgi:hypothetical protein
MPEKQPSKLELVQQLLESAEGNVKSAKQLLAELYGGPTTSLRAKAKELQTSGDGRIVEGVFDGQNMVGSDGKKYPVPANYASKSKLVEGDVLKLTILEDGSFIYKQIGPIQRRKVVGTLSMDGDDFRVLAGERSYRVLYASVTYFKGKPGDQVTLLIPEEREATWGAVENILSAPLQPEAPAEGAPVTEEVAQPEMASAEVGADAPDPVSPLAEAPVETPAPAPAPPTASPVQQPEPAMATVPETPKELDI